MQTEQLKEFDYDFFFDSMKDYKWFFLEDKGDPEFYRTIVEWFIRTGDESRLAVIVMLMGTVAMLEKKVRKEHEQDRQT